MRPYMRSSDSFNGMSGSQRCWRPHLIFTADWYFPVFSQSCIFGKVSVCLLYPARLPIWIVHRPPGHSVPWIVTWASDTDSGRSQHWLPRTGTVSLTNVPCCPANCNNPPAVQLNWQYQLYQYEAFHWLFSLPRWIHWYLIELGCVYCLDNA